jgi:voltage-gated potassium channel
VKGEAKQRPLREDYFAREELREKLDRYLDVPLALASLVVVLLIVLQLSGEVSEPWQGRLEALSWGLWTLFFLEFVAKFALAPVKREYLRRNWLDALIVVLPFLKFLRLARILAAGRAVPMLRLLVFGGRGSQSTLTLLRRRRLGQLAIISAMVILIGATVGLMLEADAPGARIKDFGDALWWSAALTTTIGSELYPVTAAGRVLAFLIMLYALGIFTYLIGSISSILVSADARQTHQEEKGPEGATLGEDDVKALRAILKKAEKP